MIDFSLPSPALEVSRPIVHLLGFRASPKIPTSDMCLKQAPIFNFKMVDFSFKMADFSFKMVGFSFTMAVCSFWLARGGLARGGLACGGLSPPCCTWRAERRRWRADRWRAFHPRV